MTYIFVIALALSTDIAAVSVSAGVCAGQGIGFFRVFKVSFIFAAAHILMLSAGWFGGEKLSGIFKSVDNWIAFAMLLFVGIKMIIQAVNAKEQKKSFNLSETKVLLPVSIATSLDALAIGVTFSILKISIISACAVVGAVTFIISFSAFLIGCKLGNGFGKKAEVAGGIVLILIGIQILLGH